MDYESVPWKLIVWPGTRKEAIARMQRARKNYYVSRNQTNCGLFRRIWIVIQTLFARNFHTDGGRLDCRKNLSWREHVADTDNSVASEDCGAARRDWRRHLRAGRRQIRANEMTAANYSRADAERLKMRRARSSHAFPGKMSKPIELKFTLASARIPSHREVRSTGDPAQVLK